MASVSDLVASLANRLEQPVPAVRQKVRNLQDNGMLPVASGRAVPSIDPEHVALAFLAVLGADAVKDATRTAERLGALIEGGISHGVAAKLATLGDPVRTLVDFLATVFSKLMAADNTPAVVRFGHADATYELCLSWPEFRAIVPVFEADDAGNRSGELQIAFGENGHPTTHWRGHVRKAVTVGGIAMSEIAFDLARASGEPAQ